MKKLVFILSLFLGLNALASQEFTCAQLQADGTYLPSSFGINLEDRNQIEILQAGEFVAAYNLNSAPRLLWTVFTSAERLSVTMKVESKMFKGRSGYVKEIQQQLEGPKTVAVYFCKPGQY